jgi:hypothetical protein
MEVTSTGTSALDLQNGHLALGDGTGDNLEVDGGFKVAVAAGQSAAFDTITTLTEGDSITIDINDAAAPCASNCVITVGASSGTGQGDFKIGKNVTLKFNSSGSVTSGMTVDSTGYLEIQGSLDDSGTATSGTNETTIEDTSKSWSANQHNNKVVRMTSGLAKFKIYDITGTTATTITRPDNSSANTTVSSISTAGPVKTITTAASVISANDEGIGRYLHDTTGGDDWYKIVDSIEGGAND